MERVERGAPCDGNRMEDTIPVGLSGVPAGPVSTHQARGHLLRRWGRRARPRHAGDRTAVAERAAFQCAGNELGDVGQAQPTG